MEHPLKVLERVINEDCEKIIALDEGQYAFKRGKRSTYAIFILRQNQESILKRRKICIMHWLIEKTK